MIEQCTLPSNAVSESHLMKFPRVPERAGDVGLLILRVITGLSLAFAHGLGKLPPSQRFIGTVAEMGFPLPVVFAWSAGLSEFVGGILLAIGLATRPAAFFIFFTLATAFFIRHADDPFMAKEKPLIFAAVALMFMLHGAGRLSLDALIARRRGKDVIAH